MAATSSALAAQQHVDALLARVEARRIALASRDRRHKSALGQFFTPMVCHERAIYMGGMETEMSVTRILELNDEHGALAEPAWLERAEAVHRELRPKIPAPYGERMAAIFRDGGRLCVAIAGDEVVGVALYRVYADTFNGKKCYIDDLVTTEKRRSRGVGHALIEHLAARARALGCDNLVLDSGTQRTQAHKFYFREGFVIPSFNFKKPL